jgi:hypothetical protein
VENLNKKTKRRNEMKKTVGKGLKYDDGKQKWYAMPLELLEPLAEVFTAGEQKYDTFNCLEPFENSDRRFYDSLMRHLESCQIDPLAIDEETGCYHQAQVAFSALLRLRNALMRVRK